MLSRPVTSVMMVAEKERWKSMRDDCYRLPLSQVCFVAPRRSRPFGCNGERMTKAETLPKFDRSALPSIAPAKPTWDAYESCAVLVRPH